MIRKKIKIRTVAESEDLDIIYQKKTNIVIKLDIKYYLFIHITRLIDII